MKNVFIIIPNWNGVHLICKSIDALRDQVDQTNIIIVDNGSRDGSVGFLKNKYRNLTIIENRKNLGFASGVNQGIRRAIDSGADYVALLNNDAVVSESWLKYLLESIKKNRDAGIVTCKMVQSANGLIDSTGEVLTIWGLPYPRGRNEKDRAQYDNDKHIFGASGGASLFKVAMLDQVGLFDEDFFAYYEDVDLSYRAQLLGWKVLYEPNAIVYHELGATSHSIRGFTTYQTIKNLPWLFIKNTPLSLFPRMLPRFVLVYIFFIISALAKKQIYPTLKGLLVCTLLFPKKIIQRYNIQRNRSVSIDYIKDIIARELPPEATRLRKLLYVFKDMNEHR